MFHCVRGCKDPEGKPLTGLYFIAVPCGAHIPLCAYCMSRVHGLIIAAECLTCQGQGECRIKIPHVVPAPLAAFGGYN